MINNNFTQRHVGPRESEVKPMLEKVGVSSIKELISETMPDDILEEKEFKLPGGLNEFQYQQHIKEVAGKNKIYRSYIGMGYYNTITPGVIQRNVLENPGWYTSYTPYQAEISQGRLEAVLNFQTMVTELTGMELANASLLDEATAAAEAMSMLHNARPRKAVKEGVNKFFVSEELFPQSIEVIKTRAESVGIEIIIGNHEEIEFDGKYFGAVVQYPSGNGEIYDYREFVKKAHENGAMVAVSADIMSLALLTPPGEWGADIVFGSTQRFGIPMGFGGPHAAYFATYEKYKRNVPGRIIGASIDVKGNRALRMALQTREQHIKRERATSNICTAQVLLANMAGFYALYHGKEGLEAIANDIHGNTALLAKELEKLGYKQNNTYYFDTLNVELPGNITTKAVEKIALSKKINLRYIGDKHVGISLDETTDHNDISGIISIFAEAAGKKAGEIKEEKGLNALPKELKRSSDFFTLDIFKKYRSETDMMRYMKKLENKDLALNRTMIPLGSCTMKLNAASEMFAISWPEFGAIHPFVPKDQAEGYHFLIQEMEKWLCEITGYAAISFQPNSGAAGEYTGLMLIREYLKSKGEGHRNITLIPSSAHGTNPASAVMAGTKVVVVKCDEQGNIELKDLKEKVEKHKDNLAALMVTYPSTHGVFEPDILEVIKVIHDNGGQVYMDGANMNAQVGYTSPGKIGADVCHLNLHKTFAIPHGGGGPGVGPVGVAEHLKPFLPSHPVVKTGGENAMRAIAAAPFGSALILPITYGYLKMLGKEGLKKSTEMAILNVNYLKAKLKNHYKILYTGVRGMVAHEMIIDCNEFKRNADVDVIDIAKRLMDYGFHAPTVAFPVHGTLMVEPTESEPLEELDRFCEAMISIREEIREIEEGKADKANNVVKNAPHTQQMIILDKWEYPYSKEKAAFPVKFEMQDKYWPPVTKVDDAYGDRNLVCTCEPIDSYQENS